MRRGTRWTLVGATCAGIVLAGTPALRSAIWGGIGRATGFMPWGVPVLELATGLVAAVAVTAGLSRLLRRRRETTQVARQLARRGESVAAIARRTGLAQDAVRDLVGVAAAAAIAERQPASPRGTNFRHGSPGRTRVPRDFAAAMRASAGAATA